MAIPYDLFPTKIDNLMWFDISKISAQGNSNVTHVSEASQRAGKLLK